MSNIPVIKSAVTSANTNPQAKLKAENIVSGFIRFDNYKSHTDVIIDSALDLLNNPDLGKLLPNPMSAMDIFVVCHNTNGQNHINLVPGVDVLIFGQQYLAHKSYAGICRVIRTDKAKIELWFSGVSI